MKFKNVLKISVLALTGLFVFSPVVAYDNLTTHPALTDEIVEFYNLSFDNKLTDVDKEWIIDGAMSEDTPPRWINHFYDPIYKLGWSGEKTGIWPAYVMRYFSKTVLSNEDPVSSLDWLHNQNLQAEYGEFKGNRTWERAIYEYANGNEKEAYYTLGFVLHLVEDMAVPDHTRDDTHAHELQYMTGDYGSPYEEYSKQFRRDNWNISKDLKNRGFNPVIKDTIDEYIVSLAEYSNKYFFSKDTIDNTKYEFPEINNIEDIGRYGYGLDKNGIKFEIINIRNIIDLDNRKFNKEYFLPENDNNSKVLNNYFTRLSREAVINGAGIINLFIQEGEKAKSNINNLNTPIGNTSGINSPANKFINVLISAKSIYSQTIDNAKSAYNKTVDSTKTVLNNIKTGAINVYNNSVSGIENLFSSSPVAQTSAVIDALDVSFNPQVGSSGTLEAVLAPVPAVITEVVSSAQAPVSAPVPAGNLSDEKLSSLQSQLDSAQAMINVLQAQANGLSDNSDNQTSVAIVETPTFQNTAKNKEPVTQPTSIPSPGFGGGAPPPAPLNPQPTPGDEISSPEPESDNTSSQSSSVSQTADTNPEEPSVVEVTPPDAPIITSPSDFSQIFTTDTITFQGIAEATSTISTDFDNATTTVGSVSDWQLSLALPQGTSTINFFATDNAGNISSSTQVSLLVDSIAPDISLTVLECENSLAATGCLTKSRELNISWGSSASDIDYFTIDNNGAFATTTATSTVISLSENSIFSFGVSARDRAGNISTTSTKAISTFNSPVVINEVAWAGTQDHSSDEWIELYNNTDYDISLNNWILEAEDGAPYLPLSGVIKAKDYYLIERSDDETISDIPADLVTPFSGAGKSSGLSNRGEVLILSYKQDGEATTTVDKTPLPNNRRWVGGSTYLSQTMERRYALVSGEDSANWGTNNRLIIKGKNIDGQRIMGTPKVRNSVSHLIANGAPRISGDILLAKANSPYLVNRQWQNFSAGSSLTIEPGVVIKFYNTAGLIFRDASIIADGTPEEPIVFTSFYDDEYGGDTNNDGASSTPSAGNWYGVDLKGDTSGRSVFDNTIFRYGGVHYDWYYASRANLKVDGASPPITNSVFEESALSGLIIANSDSVVSDNIFRSNNKGSDLSGTGASVVIGGGKPVFKDNLVEGNDRGLNISNTGATIDSNIFKSNRSEAIYATGAFPKFTNNTASGNKVNGIFIHNYISTANSTTTVTADSIPYVMKRFDVSIPVNSSVVIEKGVVIKSHAAAFRVKGKLVINGQKPNDIIFTSLYDDTVFPGTISGGTTTPTAYPQWRGIDVSSTGSVEAQGFTFKYAGMDYARTTRSGGMYVDGAPVEVKNSVFESNYPFGLRVQSSPNVVIEDTVFKNHNYKGPYGTQAGLAIYNSSTTLNNLLFENNTLGFVTDTVSSLTANFIEFIGNTASTSPAGLF